MPQETHRRSLEQIERDKTELARLAKQNPATAHERKFEEPGEYDYSCVPHPYMKGRVIVDR